MAKLGEANVGGRLVPAWLLDTPAKYLDGDLQVIQANDDLDSYTTPGEYIQGNTSVIATLVNFPVNLPKGEMCLKVSSLGGPGYICQEIKAKNGLRFSRAIRFSNNGVFQPWEYEDPELRLGVEYRTTERWNGKPVYVLTQPSKALGTAGSTVYIEGLPGNIEDMIDYRLKIKSSGGVVTMNNRFNSDGSAQCVSSVQVTTDHYAWSIIKCVSDCTSLTATCTFKYIKTTD